VQSQHVIVTAEGSDGQRIPRDPRGLAQRWPGTTRREEIPQELKVGLRNLKQLRDDDLITEEEFQAERTDIMNRL
jgi:hypothetical protein